MRMVRVLDYARQIFPEPPDINVEELTEVPGLKVFNVSFFAYNEDVDEYPTLFAYFGSVDELRLLFSAF